MTNDKLRTTNIWKPQFLPNIICVTIGLHEKVHLPSKIG